MASNGSFKLASVGLLGILLMATIAESKPSNAALLSNIKALTFYKDRMTTGRRVAPIPQVQCIGGSGQGRFEPDTIRCVNSGSSYSDSDIEWTCTASLPPEFKLGSTDVICEGYEHADDPYILKGSCGVEYRLVLTDAGEEKYRKKPVKNDPWFPDSGHFDFDVPNESSSAIGGILFFCLFFAVAGWMIYSAFFRNQRGGSQGDGGRTGWWGGGDNGGNDDPPPPYTPYPASKPHTSYYSQPRRPTSRQQASNRNQGGGWRPGFWSGAATGAAASYLAGRNSRNRQESSPQQQAPSQPFRASGSWGGSSRTHDPGEGSSTGGRPGGGFSSSPSYSATRYESTGFGGTRRR